MRERMGKRMRMRKRKRMKMREHERSMSLATADGLGTRFQTLVQYFIRGYICKVAIRFQSIRRLGKLSSGQQQPTTAAKRKRLLHHRHWLSLCCFCWVAPQTATGQGHGSKGTLQQREGDVSLAIHPFPSAA